MFLFRFFFFCLVASLPDRMIVMTLSCICRNHSHTEFKIWIFWFGRKESRVSWKNSIFVGKEKCKIYIRILTKKYFESNVFGSLLYMRRSSTTLETCIPKFFDSRRERSLFKVWIHQTRIQSPSWVRRTRMMTQRWMDLRTQEKGDD